MENFVRDEALLYRLFFVLFCIFSWLNFFIRVYISDYSRIFDASIQDVICKQHTRCTEQIVMSKCNNMYFICLKYSTARIQADSSFL